MEGYILIWRKILETSFYKDSYALHLAMHLLLKANHKENSFTFNKKNIVIQRGQMICGRFTLSQETGIKPSTIRNKLALLKNIGFLDIKSNNKFSIISILNYESYQNSKIKQDSKKDSKRTARGQQEDTNKECNNDKNDKNKDILSGKPDLIAPIEYLNLKTKSNFDPKNKSNQDLVRARYNEGRTFEQFKTVIDKKVIQWLNDEKMMKYLRPSTLFNRTKFEEYLNEPISEFIIQQQARKEFELK